MCYEQGLSLWLHEVMVKESLYRFKYQDRRVYGKFYAEELYRRYKDKLKEWEIECIIPIPLHRRRRRKRGYNQAEIIATYLGNLSHIPVEKDAILRMTETKPQKELSQRERKRNLKNAFCVKKGWKPAKSVLLIDDIYTTGNTIHSVAKVLKEKGVRKVWFLTISIGQGF
jgi:ComF family protein